jgi:hypothetical protein
MTVKNANASDLSVAIQSFSQVQQTVDLQLSIPITSITLICLLQCGHEVIS